MKIDDSLRIKMKQINLKENHNVISTYFILKGVTEVLFK
jgi:hypothetical protein